ncbi:uncharacterized protein HD556DRAFT_844234 [Suillus plorans]|uniref:Uncharacterized protein n=1 Tax=Suillus plorans TaxID=116603 RepID=A0A9P7DDR5_9AGAM|nr:uncharacterized protein HD556DRAFT_844234 [Suillus plorans]KAG1788748.1 hypothetical protein HD556DRAFT_844234 [Suillus plorans]
MISCWQYGAFRFQQEATFLAQANTNVAKFLYIGARYIPLLSTLSLVFKQVFHMANVDCQRPSALWKHSVQNVCDLRNQFHLNFHWAHRMLGIFGLRTCAMWEVKWPLRWVMFMIIAGMAVAGLIIFCFVPKQYVFVPDVSACQVSQFAKMQRLLAALLALLMLEFVLVIIATIKAAKIYRSTPRPLLTLLLTHHMFYYGCGFLLSIINVLCVTLFEYEYAAIFLRCVTFSECSS